MALRFLLIACFQITLIILIQHCSRANHLFRLQDYTTGSSDHFTLLLKNDARFNRNGDQYKKPAGYNSKSTCSRLLIINYEQGLHTPGSLFRIYVKIRITSPLQITMYMKEKESYIFIGFIEAHFIKPTGLRVIEFNLPDFIEYNRDYQIIVSTWVTSSTTKPPSAQALGIINFTTAGPPLVERVGEIDAGQRLSAIPETLRELCSTSHSQRGKYILNSLKAGTLDLDEICTIVVAMTELQKFRMRLFGVKSIVPPLDALKGMEAFLLGEDVLKYMAKFIYSTMYDFTIQVLSETLQIIEQLSDSFYVQYYGPKPVEHFKDKAHKILKNELLQHSGDRILFGALTGALSQLSDVFIPNEFSPNFEKCNRMKYMTELVGKTYIYGQTSLWPSQITYYDHQTTPYSDNSLMVSPSGSKNTSPSISRSGSRTQTLPPTTIT